MRNFKTKVSLLFLMVIIGPSPVFSQITLQPGTIDPDLNISLPTTQTTQNLDGLRICIRPTNADANSGTNKTLSFSACSAPPTKQQYDPENRGSFFSPNITFLPWVSSASCKVRNVGLEGVPRGATSCREIPVALAKTLKFPDDIRYFILQSTKASRSNDFFADELWTQRVVMQVKHQGSTDWRTIYDNPCDYRRVEIRDADPNNVTGGFTDLNTGPEAMVGTYSLSDDVLCFGMQTASTTEAANYTAAFGDGPETNADISAIIPHDSGQVLPAHSSAYIRNWYRAGGPHVDYYTGDLIGYQKNGPTMLDLGSLLSIKLKWPNDYKRGSFHTYGGTVWDGGGRLQEKVRIFISPENGNDLAGLKSMTVCHIRPIAATWIKDRQCSFHKQTSLKILSTDSREGPSGYPPTAGSYVDLITGPCPAECISDTQNF